MEKVENKSLFDKYIRESEISKLFSQDMSDNMELFSLKKGDILINEGESSDYLFFLVSGRMKVFSHSSCGKVMFLSHFHPFQIIGETCSLWKKPPTASVQATTKCYCLGISIVKYQETLLNDATFLRHTCMSLGERLSSITSNACITLFDSLESRLASFILKSAENNTFSYNLTECAELLCTSYRHLLRIINVFCNTGKLKKEGKNYIILDSEYLEQIASTFHDLNNKNN